MKRDNDLIRKLLFEFEAAENWLLIMPGTTLNANMEEWQERYHILLLMDDGFVTDVAKGTFRLTAQGHDFVEAIRSDTVWKRTKDGVSSIGGATLGMVKDLAVAYLKQEAAEKLGVQL